MSGFIEWLGDLDPQLLAVATTVLAGLFTIRASRMAARSAGQAIITQKEIARSSEVKQQTVADLSASAQLIATREQHRVQEVHSTYIGIVQHVQAWNTWAHQLNRYLYASKELRDPEWDYWQHRSPDDPRDPRDLMNPAPQDVPMPSQYPPDLHALGDIEARVSMYASDEIRLLMTTWSGTAKNLRSIGLYLTGAGGYGAWIQQHSEYKPLLNEMEKEYPQSVKRLDNASKEVVDRVRFEMEATRTAILDDRPESTWANDDSHQFAS
jgi:hypothetical protein